MVTCVVAKFSPTRAKSYEKKDHKFAQGGAKLFRPHASRGEAGYDNSAVVAQENKRETMGFIPVNEVSNENSFKILERIRRRIPHGLMSGCLVREKTRHINSKATFMKKTNPSTNGNQTAPSGLRAFTALFSADIGHALRVCVTAAIMIVGSTASAVAGWLTIDSIGGIDDGVNIKNGRYKGQPTSHPASNQYRGMLAINYAVNRDQRDSYIWTITGSGFGTKWGSVWLLNDDFDSVRDTQVEIKNASYHAVVASHILDHRVCSRRIRHFRDMGRFTPRVSSPGDTQMKLDEDYYKLFPDKRP